LTSIIKGLKQKKEVTILTHFYQPFEIQSVADYIGDSLELTKIARDQIKQPNVLFAGVRFMAETAAILNPDKNIFIPEGTACCPLADFLDPPIIDEFRGQYPYTPVVIYMNSTAETKAKADICCTASNALQIIQKITQEWKTDTILFGPDKNLADWVEAHTSINIIKMPGEGKCPYHDVFTIQDVQNARKDYPKAAILVHPEAPYDVLHAVDFVGPSISIERYVKGHKNPAGFVIGTDTNMVDYLRGRYPEKIFYPLSLTAFCVEMKKNSLEKMISTLEAIGTPQEQQYKIQVPPEIAERAKKSIELMLEYSD
jgi:quinolinate synthase